MAWLSRQWVPLCLLLLAAFFILIHKIVFRSAPVLQSSAWQHSNGGSEHVIAILEQRECNLSEFTRLLSVTSGAPVIPRHLVANCNGIIYNRVPKCASRFIKDLFSVVISHNGFSLIYFDGQYYMRSKTKARYIAHMKAARYFVLVSHFFYVDLGSFIDDPLVYINILRDPLSWFESIYFFHKYGGTAHPRNKPWTSSFAKSLPDCVRSDKCFTTVHRQFGPLRFLCGAAANCNEASSATLQKAKANIEQRYLVVGVYEDLQAFSQVLEYLLPHIFRGITDTYLPRAATENRTHSTATSRKDPVDEATKDILRQRLRYDIELYQFARKRFYDLRNAIVTISRQVTNTSIALSTTR